MLVLIGGVSGSNDIHMLVYLCGRAEMCEENITNDNIDVIKEDDYVVVRSEDVYRLIQINRKKPVFLNKRKLFFGEAIGQPFGSIFELNGRDLRKVDAEEVYKNTGDDSLEPDHVASGTDNRNILDDGKSQTLTKEVIETLKSDGVSGQEIIGSLVENSKTFKEKTAYAQLKYLKKKKKKYMQYLVMERPSTRLLAEMYYSQNPLKIGNLRIDLLSQMLSACNIMPHGKYIVFDSYLGLVTAAVLERLGRNGTVVQVYSGQGPVSSYRQAVSALNFQREHLTKVLMELPFTKAHKLIHPSETSQDVTCDVLTDESNTTEDQLVGVCEKASHEHEEQDTQEEGAEELAKPADSNPKKEERALRRTQRIMEQEKALELLKEKNLDGVVVACKNHPTEVVLTLLEFLAPSRPFAVFSTYQEPLLDCYIQLRSRRNSIFLKLSETWLRKFQVLPNRSHPDNTMSGGGGYLLTGIKVEPAP